MASISQHSRLIYFVRARAVPPFRGTPTKSAARLRRGQTKPTPTNASTSRGKKKTIRDVFERSSSKPVVTLTLEPSARAYARGTDREKAARRRLRWFAKVAPHRRRRDASETRRFALNPRRVVFFSSRKRSRSSGEDEAAVLPAQTSRRGVRRAERALFFGG